MKHAPFRTGTTWLDDEQLVLLDALFEGHYCPYRLLRRENFLAQWNLGYSHSLDDSDLESSLKVLCEHGVLEREHHGDQNRFGLTCHGGEMWSCERTPIWDRYCATRHDPVDRGRSQLVVMSISPRIRDEFLRLWPEDRLCNRSSDILHDHALVSWQSFAEVHVGIATYDDVRTRTPNEARSFVQRRAKGERERTWWQGVAQLQRFVGESHD